MAADGLKAAVYARVSTQDQNLDEQVKACKDYCDRQGWQCDVFQEKMSGAKQSRPQLDWMLQRVRAGEYGAVVAWKLDRVGRSTLHLIQIVEELRNKNVRFVVVTQGFDTGSAEGRAFLTILAAIAELEREYIRERTALRLAAIKRKEQETGKKILGRPAGSKDKGVRRKSGYLMREAIKRGKQLTPQEVACLDRDDQARDSNGQ